MYQCPNCNGNLKFNIKRQRMLCEHCNSTFNPNQFGDGEGAKQSEIEVTVFTCPQCAGELFTTDNEMAGFCTFCGSTTVMESRIANEKRPDYIIPFQQTKDDCKEAYLKLMKNAFFVPKALKSPEYIEGFRGIYMPYWIYDVKQEGELNLSGKCTTVDEDYLTISHYKFDGKLSSKYEGIAYDGSSALSDTLSRKLMPYKMNSVREFSPAYLSGFYAEAADLEADVYEEDVKALTDKRTGEYVKNYYGFDSYTIDTKDDAIVEQLGTTIAKKSQAMLPIWFVSYRNKDWVAYATVNGQTGKVVADLPVDVKKYLLYAILLAVPIYTVLSLIESVHTITPVFLIQIILVLSAMVALLYDAKVKQIVKREKLADDKGAIVAKQRQENTKVKKRKKKKSRLKRRKTWAIETIITGIILAGCFLYILAPVIEEEVLPLLEELPYQQMWEVLVLFAGALTVIVSLVSLIRSIGLKLWRFLPTPFFGLFAALVAIGMIVLQPVLNVSYYIGALLLGCVLIYTMIDLIKRYNIFATRRLPQFERRGGDGNA